MELLPNYILLEMLFGAVALSAVLFLLGKRPPDRENLERDDFLDFLKGAAIVAVVCVHASGLARAGRPLNDFLGPAVELFVLASGYLLARRHVGKIDLNRYFSGIATRILAIYFIFSLALHLANHGLAILPYEFGLDLLLGRLNGGNLYFIPVIVQFYLLFPLLSRYRKILASPLAAIAAFVLFSAVNYADITTRQPAWDSNQLALVFCGRYVFYFLFGMYLSSFSKITTAQSARAAGAVLLCIAALSALNQALYLGYIYPVFAFFALHAAFHALRRWRITGKLVLAVNGIGKKSLLIYILHTVALYALLKELPLGLGGAAQYVAYVAAALALSYAGAVAFMAAYGSVIRRFASQA